MPPLFGSSWCCQVGAGLLLLIMGSGPGKGAEPPVRGESYHAAGMADGEIYGPALVPSVGSNWVASPPEFLCGSLDGTGLDEMVSVERVSDVLARVWIAQPGDVAHRLDRSVIYPSSGVARLGDVDGDGRQDLVLFYRNGFGGAEAGDVMVCLARSDALGFAAAVKWHELFSLNDETPLVADFDGDGRADLATVFNGGTGAVYGALSNGTAFAATGTLWASGIAPAGNKPIAADLNGDRKVELIVTTFVSPRRDFSVYEFVPVDELGNPARVELVPDVSLALATGTEAERLVTGDVNGDGRGDVWLVPGLSSAVAQGIGARLGTTSAAARPGLGEFAGYTPVYGPSSAEPPVYYAGGRLNDDLSDDLLAITVLPASPPGLPEPSARFFKRLSGDPAGQLGPWVDNLIGATPQAQTAPFTVTGKIPESIPLGSLTELRLRWLDQTRTWREGPLLPLPAALTSITVALPPEAVIGTFGQPVQPLRVSLRVRRVFGTLTGEILADMVITSNVRLISTQDPYKAWAVAFGLNLPPFVGYTDDDPDGDGLGNLLEFLAGTNPLAFTAAEDGDAASVSPADHYLERCTWQPLFVNAPGPILLGRYPRFDFHLRYLPERAARFPWRLQDSTGLGAWEDTGYASDLPWTNSATTYRITEAGSAYEVAHVEEFATDTNLRPKAFRRLKHRLSEDVIRPRP